MHTYVRMCTRGRHRMVTEIKPAKQPTFEPISFITGFYIG